MGYIRSFISIDLPENVRDELRQLQENFRKTRFSRFKWVTPSSIHLTLKFLGNVEENKIDLIKRELERVAENFTSFELTLKETGLFPGIKKPRVVWVGLGGSVEVLSHLQKSVDSSLASLGFAPENRPFVPHLTLARIPEGSNVSELAEFSRKWLDINIKPDFYFLANSINLMQSILKPSGAVYICLASISLKTQ